MTFTTTLTSPQAEAEDQILTPKMRTTTTAQIEVAVMTTLDEMMSVLVFKAAETIPRPGRMSKQRRMPDMILCRASRDNHHHRRIQLKAHCLQLRVTIQRSRIISGTLLINKTINSSRISILGSRTKALMALHSTISHSSSSINSNNNHNISNNNNNNSLRLQLDASMGKRLSWIMYRSATVLFLFLQTARTSDACYVSSGPSRAADASWDAFELSSRMLPLVALCSCRIP